MEYPKEILPRKNYIKNIDVDRLLANIPKAQIVRRADKPVVYVTNSLGDKVLAEDTFTGNVFDYSTNLLGAYFHVEEHLGLRQLGEGKADWNGETTFESIKDELWGEVKAYPVRLYINPLQHKSVPYKRTFEKAELLKGFISQWDMKASETASKIWKGKNNDYDFEAELRVEHHPTNLNYWHMAIDIYPDRAAKEYFKSPKGAWGNKLASYVIIILRDSVAQEEADYQIPEELYISNQENAQH